MAAKVSLARIHEIAVEQPRDLARWADDGGRVS